MRLEECRREFAVRVYRWAQAEWQTEIETGYQLLQLVRDQTPIIVVELLRDVDADQRNTLVAALLKRAHREATSILGEEMTATERALLDAHDERMLWRRSSHFDASVTAGSFNRNRMKAAVCPKLRGLCGELSKDWGSRMEWRHETKIRQWHVHTYVDIGGRSRQLSYHHMVALAPPRVYLSQAALSLSVLGIVANEWTLLQAGEEEWGANAAVTVCQRTMSALPELLDGLHVDE